MCESAGPLSEAVRRGRKMTKSKRRTGRCEDEGPSEASGRSCGIEAEQTERAGLSCTARQSRATATSCESERRQGLVSERGRQPPSSLSSLGWRLQASKHSLRLYPADGHLGRSARRPRCRQHAIEKAAPYSLFLPSPNTLANRPCFSFPPPASSSILDVVEARSRFP